MYKTPLTDAQKASNFAESIYRPIIEALKQKRGALDIPHAEFAERIGISTDTWLQWRRAVNPKVKKKTGVDVQRVLEAASLAHLKVSVEVAL